MRKTSCDLAVGCGHAESFGLSTLIGTICGKFLSNKIVMCFRDGQPLALRILGQTSLIFVPRKTVLPLSFTSFGGIYEA